MSLSSFPIIQFVMNFKTLSSSKYIFPPYLQLFSASHKLQQLTQSQSSTLTKLAEKIKPIKMNAALCYAPSLPPLTPTNKTSFTQVIFPAKLQATLVSRCTPITATAVESSTFDYSSNTSVFPAEACDTVGGEACNAEMYPEVKLEPENKSTTPKIVSDSVDREYLEYDEPKTVFPAEACDDLGGEFCQPEYQKGVY